MKRKLNHVLTAAALILSSAASFYGQNYWEKEYYTTTAPLQTNRTSSAKVLNFRPGAQGEFLVSSHETSSNGTYNFQLLRTDETGWFSNVGAPTGVNWDFFNGFNAYYHPSPTFPSPPVLDDIYGTDAIECGNFPSPASDPHYAVAGTGQNAIGVVLFVTLLNDEGLPGGAPKNYFWQFPPGTTIANKPTIIEEPGNPLYFFVCGSFYNGGTETGYAFYLDGLTGNLTWSNYYDAGLGISFKDMIISPYNPDDIVIVGRVNVDANQSPGFSRGPDGFFLELSHLGGGSINIFNVFGHNQTNNDPENWFSCISEASSPWGGGAGYVVGGRSQPYAGGTPGLGNSWMLKLDQNGVIGSNWNTLIVSSMGNIGDITDVVERPSVYNTFEYYGVTSENISRMTVFKLDETGTLNSTGSTNNEFNYTNLGGGEPAYLTTMPNSWTGGGDISVWGTYPTNNSIYAIKASASGETGCESLTTANQGIGPFDVINPAITAVTGWPPLPSTYITNAGIVTGTFTPGDNTADVVEPCSTTTGDPNRPAMSVDEQGIMSLQSYPNPTSDKVTFGRISSSEIQAIYIYNNLGMQVGKIDSKDLTSESDGTSLHLSETGLSNGVYFLKIETAQKVYDAKVMLQE